MTVNGLVLFVHLAGAATLFLAFGIEWAAISFLGTAKSPEEAKQWLRLGRLGPLINGPALGVLILSGGYLAYLMGAGTMKQGWIVAAFLGIVVVAALGGAINVPKMRAIRQAISEGGEKLFALLRSKALPVSVRLRTFTALSIVFMMTAKLPLAQCMLVLVVGLIVGLFFCIPVFVRKTA